MKLHVRHINCSAVDMAMETMCPCNSHHHEITHWKCVFPSLIIPLLETNKYTRNTCSTIYFHVYRNISSLLFMVNAIKKTAHHVLCVPLMLFLWLLEKYTHINSLCYLRPIYQNFMKNNTLQLYINWNFICHMCVLWGKSTVAKISMGPLNAE